MDKHDYREEIGGVTHLLLVHLVVSRGVVASKNIIWHDIFADFDESNFDSDLEAFQFIHEESIKDENIANIIQVLKLCSH